MHSVHLREERKGRGATRWGEGQGGWGGEGYIYTVHASTTDQQRKITGTRLEERHKQIRHIRWCTDGLCTF